MPKYQRKIDRWVKKHGCPTSRPRPRKTAFLDYYDKHLPEIQEHFSTEKRYAQHNYRTKASEWTFLDEIHHYTKMTDTSSRYLGLPLISKFILECDGMPILCKMHSVKFIYLKLWMGYLI